MLFNQFEVVLVNLEPTKWSEQSWVRLCVILQTNAISDYWNTTIVAPLTSKKILNIYPYEVFVKKGSVNGLKEDSKLKLDQIKVIDKSRIIKKLWTILDEDIRKDILVSLDILFDRNWDFR